MIAQVKINNAICKLSKRTLEVSSRLSVRVSTVRFGIVGEETWATPALSNSGNIVAFGGFTRPHMKDEVQINNIAFARWLDNFFGGYIATVDHKRIGGRKVYYCSAQDYNIRLHSILVDKTYAAPQTEQQIIDDLFSTYWSDIDTTTYVDGTNAVASINFPRLLLDEALDQLAELFDKSWYVDYQKKLHYFDPADITAPFAIQDVLL